MKQVALFCGLISGLLMSGCDTTRPSEAIAGAEGSTTAVAAAGTQPSPQPDPAANGGSSLPASAPYDGGGATVTQNVNPAPFLAGTSSQTSGTASAPPSPNALTSRADGTMIGSNDQPAASTTWGTPATNWTSPAASPAAKPPAKKKK
jgi:hypothetical protein